MYVICFGILVVMSICSVIPSEILFVCAYCLFTACSNAHLACHISDNSKNTQETQMFYIHNRKNVGMYISVRNIQKPGI